MSINNELKGMNIIINNTEYHFEEGVNLLTALASLKMDEKKGIAVAVNDTIIPKMKWQEMKLLDGDKIIIIGAVAGG